MCGISTVIFFNDQSLKVHTYVVCNVKLVVTFKIRFPVAHMGQLWVRGRLARGAYYLRSQSFICCVGDVHYSGCIGTVLFSLAVSFVISGVAASIWGTYRLISISRTYGENMCSDIQLAGGGKVMINHETRIAVSIELST